MEGSDGRRWGGFYPFQDAEGFPIDVRMTDNGDRTFFCVYVPTKAIKHTIIVTWADVNVPNSPFRVKTPRSRLQEERADLTVFAVA